MEVTCVPQVGNPYFTICSAHFRSTRGQQRYGRNAQFFSLAFVPKCVRQPIASWHSIAHVSTQGRIPYVTEDLTWNLNFASIALWFSKSNPCIVFAGNKFYTSEQAQPLLGTTIQSVTFIKIKRNFPEVPQIRTTKKNCDCYHWTWHHDKKLRHFLTKQTLRKQPPGISHLTWHRVASATKATDKQ